MPRRRSATLQFNAIRLVGGLLPASLIERSPARRHRARRPATTACPRTCGSRWPWTRPGAGPGRCGKKPRNSAAVAREHRGGDGSAPACCGRCSAGRISKVLNRARSKRRCTRSAIKPLVARCRWYSRLWRTGCSIRAARPTGGMVAAAPPTTACRSGSTLMTGASGGCSAMARRCGCCTTTRHWSSRPTWRSTFPTSLGEAFTKSLLSSGCCCTPAV
jgi:hypothetical protein